MLARGGRVLEFLGAGRQPVAAAGIPAALPNGEPDPGLIVADPLRV